MSKFCDIDGLHPRAEEHHGCECAMVQCIYNRRVPLPARDHHYPTSDFFAIHGRILTSVVLLAFEMVSAFGSGGLSLGIPGQTYALSGDFSTPSKIITCIMVSVCIQEPLSFQLTFLSVRKDDQGTA